MYGWKKDPYDDRDKPYKRKLIRLPQSYQIPVIPPILDQGNWGACVGFTFSSILAGEAKIDGRDAAFSQWWIYNGARFIEGSLLEDSGCYPRDALAWIKKQGCLLHSYWPYTPFKFDTTAPPSEFMDEADDWPVRETYRIQGGIESICDVIASKHYASIGGPWFSKWNETGPDGRLPDLTGNERMSGGHEYFLHGFDFNKEAFHSNNSWGHGFGVQGRMWVPFQAVEKFRYWGGYDAHYLDVDWTGTPQPAKKGCWLCRWLKGVKA